MNFSKRRQFQQMNVALLDLEVITLLKSFSLLLDRKYSHKHEISYIGIRPITICHPLHQGGILEQLVLYGSSMEG